MLKPDNTKQDTQAVDIGCITIQKIKVRDVLRILYRGELHDAIIEIENWLRVNNAR